MNISVSNHNCSYDIVADWIEGNLLYSKDSFLSKSDISDVLLEEGIYRKQDFANEFINDCWTQIEKRQNCLEEKKIFEVGSKRIKRIINWEEFPAYGFCLAISLKTYYNIKITSPSNFINIQGEYFERISNEALKIIFPEWDIYHTGWSPTNKPKFRKILKSISEKLNIAIGANAEEHYTKNQKDAKLDILLTRKFFDNYCNIPIILLQCASGDNWTKKTSEPNVELWKKLLEFNSWPIKGLTIPFSLMEKDFILHSTYIKGLLMDRMRLVTAYLHSPKFIDGRFKNDINRFTKKIINKIPRLD